MFEQYIMTIGGTISIIGVACTAIENDGIDTGATTTAMGISTMLTGFALNQTAELQNLDATEAYIQSLSKDELESLHEEISQFINDEQTDILNQKMDLIEGAQQQGEISEVVLDEKRQQVLTEYFSSLDENEFDQVYNKLNLEDKIEDSKMSDATPEERLDRQLKKVK